MQLGIRLDITLACLLPGGAAVCAMSAGESGNGQLGVARQWTILHILGLLLAREAGYEAQHVPYDGGPW